MHRQEPASDTELGKSASRAALLLTLLAIGCGETHQDWKKAEATNTAEAYAEFLAKHPQDSHADDARARIETIDWGARLPARNSPISTPPTWRFRRASICSFPLVADLRIIH